MLNKSEADSIYVQRDAANKPQGNQPTSLSSVIDFLFVLTATPRLSNT